MSNPQSSEELKPCPFCGCITAFVRNFHNTDRTGLLFIVECEECLAQGPCLSKETESINAWNNRYNDLLPLCEEVVKCLEMPDFEHDGKQDGIGTRLLNAIAKIKGNSNDSQVDA